MIFIRHKYSPSKGLYVPSPLSCLVCFLSFTMISLKCTESHQEYHNKYPFPRLNILRCVFQTLLKSKILQTGMTCPPGPFFHFALPEGTTVLRQICVTTSLGLMYMHILSETVFWSILIVLHGWHYTSFGTSSLIGALLWVCRINPQPVFSLCF